MNLTIKKSRNKASPYEAKDKRQYEQLKELPSQREVFILLSLRANGDEGVYGLDIQRGIEECSKGAIRLSNGSLYSLLKRLRNKKYLDSYEGDPLGGGAKRQYYFLTEAGQSLVHSIDNFLAQLKNWTPE